MTTGKRPTLRELTTGPELAAIEQHASTHATSEEASGLDAHLARLRAAVREAQEETAAPPGGASFAAFSDRLHATVLAILAAPHVIDGHVYHWTRAGMLRHAELEDIAPALVHAMIDALVDSNQAMEVPSGGIVILGE